MRIRIRGNRGLRETMIGSGCTNVPRPMGRVCLFGGARTLIGGKTMPLTTATVSHLCDHAGYRP